MERSLRREQTGVEAAFLLQLACIGPFVRIDRVDLDGFELFVVREPSEDCNGLVIVGKHGGVIASGFVHRCHFHPFSSIEIEQFDTGKG